MNFIRFKNLLMERGLKQWQLANALGWYPTKLSGIVCGHYQARREDAEAICKALDVDMGELFAEFAAAGNGKSKNRPRRWQVEKENPVEVVT